MPTNSTNSIAGATWDGVILRAIYKPVSLIDPNYIFENGQIVYGQDNSIPPNCISHKVGDGITAYSQLPELLGLNSLTTTIADELYQPLGSYTTPADVQTMINNSDVVLDRQFFIGDGTDETPLQPALDSTPTASSPLPVTSDGLYRAFLATEQVANKATSFAVINDILYPTVKAVSDALATKQALLGFTPENIANKGQANGYVPLNSSAKIDASYFPDTLLGNLHWGGSFDGITVTANTQYPQYNGQALPTADNTNEGIYFIATTNFTYNGKDYLIGDWILSYSTIGWDKVENSDAVSLVFGRAGNIVANADDYAAFYPSLSGAYADPSWITSLSYTKLTGAPTNVSAFTNDAGYIRSSAFSPSAPLSYNPTTGALTISQANATTDGYLSHTDWTTFNSKQAALVIGNGLTKTGSTVTLGGFLSADVSLAFSNHDITFSASGTTSLFQVINADSSGTGAFNQAFQVTNTQVWLGSYGSAGGSVTQRYLSDKTNGLTIQDDIHSKGVAYTADYSVNGSTNPLWIPNIGYISNNFLSTSGTYTNPSWITSLPYSKITGAPEFATVATSGSYTDLSNLPANISAFSNDSGYITSSALSAYAPANSPEFTGQIVLPYTSYGLLYNDNAGNLQSAAIGAYNRIMTDVNGKPIAVVNHPDYFYPGSSFLNGRANIAVNNAITTQGTAQAPQRIIFLGDSRLGFATQYILDAIGQYGKLNSIGFISPFANLYTNSVTWSQTGGTATRNDTTSYSTWGIAGARWDCGVGNTWSVQPNIKYTADKIRIFYNITVGGGSFTYQIDSSSPVTVNTTQASGADTLGTITINTGLGNQSSHTVLITGVTGNSRIYGMEFENQAQPGFIVDVLQSGGSAAYMWNTTGVNTYTKAYIAAMNPALFNMWLDVNDANAGRTAAQFLTDIQGIISGLSLPTTCGITLSTYFPEQSATGSGLPNVAANTLQSQYRTGIMGLVSTLGISVYDLFSSLPPLAYMNAQGYYSDMTHPSFAFATYIWSGWIRAIMPYFNNTDLSGNYWSYRKTSMSLPTNGSVGISALAENGFGILSDSLTGLYFNIDASVINLHYNVAGTKLIQFGHNGTVAAGIAMFPTASNPYLLWASRQGNPASNAFQIQINSDNSTTLSTNNAALQHSASLYNFQAVSANTNSSSTYTFASLTPNINQSGSAAYNAFLVSVYENAVGTGPKYLINAGTNTVANGAFGTHTSKFSVDDSGNVFMAGTIALTNATGLPLSTGVTGLLSNANLANLGSDDYAAIKELGSGTKGWPPGFLHPVQAGNAILVSGTIVWEVIYIPVATTITGVQFMINASGAYTSTGYNGFALYSVNTSTGALTQVASTASSSTIWTTAAGFGNIPFSSTYSATEGVYVIAMLYQSSAQTTAPALACAGMYHSVYGSRDFPNNIKMAGTSTGTTLPSSINFSAIGIYANIPYVYLY